MSSLQGWHLISHSENGRERTTHTLRQSCFTTSRLAENAAACCAEYNGLRVRQDGRNGEAALASVHEHQKRLNRGKYRRTRALHVHEVGVGRLHDTLELVATLLVLGTGAESPLLRRTKIR